MTQPPRRPYRVNPADHLLRTERRVLERADQLARRFGMSRNYVLDHMLRAALLESDDPRWQVTDTKTGRTRDVSLDAETVETLRRHRVRHAEERLATHGAYEDGDWVFAKEDGTHVDPKMLTWGFQELSRKAGLPVIHLHDLRHLSATLDLVAGTDIKVVSKRLGHARTATTQDLYQHVLDEMQDQAAEGRAALLARPTGTREAGL